MALNKSSGIGLSLLVVVLIVGAVFMFGGSKKPAKDLTRPALSACKGFIEKYMSGAEFPAQSPSLTEETPGIYSIAIAVKVPDRDFTAKCIMRYEDPGWKLISLKE